MMSNKIAKRRSSRKLQQASKREDRHGAAVIELAICLPVLTVLTFGFIDITNYVYFQQTLKVACYDGARAASDNGGTVADVNVAVSRLMDAREIDNWTLQTFGLNSNTERGDQVEVRLTAPIGEVTHFSALQFWQDSNITVAVTAVRE